MFNEINEVTADRHFDTQTELVLNPFWTHLIGLAIVVTTSKYVQMSI